MSYYYKKKLLKSFLNNSIYLYLAHFSDYILALLILPYISRALGLIEFGIIGLAQTFGILVVLVMEFGSPIVSTREISRLKGDVKLLKNYVGLVTAFKIYIIPLSCFLTLFAIFSVPIFSENPTYLIIVLIGSIFQGISPFWYFQGIEKMKEIAKSKIIFRSIGFLIIIFFVKSPSDGWIVLTSYTLTNIFICISFYYKIIQQLGYFKLLSLNDCKKIFYKNLQSFAITIIPMIYHNVCIIMLSIFVSPVQLGIFYGINRIYRAFNTLFGPISQAFFPLISSESIKNKSTTKLLAKGYLGFISCIGFLFMFIGNIFSEEIIILILGTDFIPGSELLKLFSIVLPLTAISNAIGRQWLMTHNQDFYFLIIQSFSFLIAFLSFCYFLNTHLISRLSLVL